MNVIINGVEWDIVFVKSNDGVLFSPTGYTLGVTDIVGRCIYIANDLSGDLLYDVIFHELTHAWLHSYGYEVNIPCEELVCQVVERESDNIQYLTNMIYGNL